MSYGLIDHETLENIAAAIRVKAASTHDYYPRDMANAIMQIVTSGEGFNEPVCFDYKDIPLGSSWPPFNTGIKAVEVMTQSELENAQDPDNYHEVTKNIEWTAMSPGKMDLYLYSNNNNLKYCIVVDNGSEKRASFLNMSEMFKNNSLITAAISGTYTNNMYRAFYSCTALTSAACGPNVENLSYAYAYCTGLTTAKCGEGVKDMSNAYQSCTSLTKAEVGENVENLAYAYNGCYSLTGDITIPEKVKNIACAFSGGVNITGIAIVGDKLPDNSDNLGAAFSGRTAGSGPYSKREVVVVYLSTYDIILKPANSFFGSNIEWTEEEYDEPVAVTIDNKTYNVVMCSYNEDINTYVYCTMRRLTEGSQNE